VQPISITCKLTTSSKLIEMELLPSLTSQKSHMQQKLASQMPRGTRLDATGNLMF